MEQNDPGSGQCQYVFTITTIHANTRPMPPPLRILRNMVERVVPRPPLNPRQQEREHRVLQAGEALLAAFGRQGITFALLATALRISAASLRWHYADLDALLAKILRRHLRAIAAALDAVPAAAPNRGPALRAAYLAATRNPDGTLKPAHLLLTRDRHLLPPDELAPIEQARNSLARQLAAGGPANTIDIADTAWIDAAGIEPVLATLAANPPAQRAAPTSPKPASPNPALPTHIQRAIETGNVAWLAAEPPEGCQLAAD